jgi:plasmid stability protein
VILCYCEFVKNVTISLPDDVYRRARITAAERDTSISALVRDFLMKLEAEESDSEQRKRLQKEVLATVRRFRASARLTRDQVHDRNALR